MAGPLRGVDYMVIILIQFPHSLLIGPANQSCMNIPFGKFPRIPNPYGSEISPQSRLNLNYGTPGPTWSNPQGENHGRLVTALVRGSRMAGKKTAEFLGGGNVEPPWLLGPKKLKSTIPYMYPLSTCEKSTWSCFPSVLRWHCWRCQDQAGHHHRVRHRRELLTRPGWNSSFLQRSVTWFTSASMGLNRKELHKLIIVYMLCIDIRCVYIHL